MYQYIWDEETNGLLLTDEIAKFSKEPRPVYYKELDLLGFGRYWNYPKDDSAPIMWAEANKYIYKGRTIARITGGSLYTKPEITIIEEPEPKDAKLKLIDIDGMVKKNKQLLQALAQETIKDIYNTYLQFKGKVDIFHVAFSGGKDSVVTLDLVQRALPHNAFVVIFGDTGMEFPDTYTVVNEEIDKCQKSDIKFYIAKSPEKPINNWYKFGPPSSTLRWCCSVHKTTPQLLTLRNITGKSNLVEMAFVGIRAQESVRRSEYTYVSLGTKQKGQYSCNPILKWSSAEVYLYLYANQLPINEAYKKGSRRAGCLYCPMATEKSDFINSSLYPTEIEPFINVIREQYNQGVKNPKLLHSYLENKGWKARKNGRDLTIGTDNYDEIIVDNKRIIEINTNDDIWKEWMKTVGVLDCDDKIYHLKVKNNVVIDFSVQKTSRGGLAFTFPESLSKSEPTIFKYIKNNLKKTISCVSCLDCEANCPYGNLRFVNGRVQISNNCIKCCLCNRHDHGCLVYKSLVLPKGTGTMKKGSIDEYGTHPIQVKWLAEFKNLKDKFNDENSLGSAMVPKFKKFLRNAGVLDKNNHYTSLTEILFRSSLEDENIWALMFAGLVYSSQIGWLINNIDFHVPYNQNEIKNMLGEFLTTKTGPANVANAYKKIAETPLSRVGFGKIVGKDKNGFIFERDEWISPCPEVILYSLYKFAEACGAYYQFTLSVLMDDTIQREGISPTKIFGIDRDTMIRILNGLSTKYPDFISASFTLDLENITLRDNKSSLDVLDLF